MSLNILLVSDRGAVLERLPCRLSKGQGSLEQEYQMVVGHLLVGLKDPALPVNFQDNQKEEMHK